MHKRDNHSPGYVALCGSWDLYDVNLESRIINEWIGVTCKKCLKFKKIKVKKSNITMRGL